MQFFQVVSNPNEMFFNKSKVVRKNGWNAFWTIFSPAFWDKFTKARSEFCLQSAKPPGRVAFRQPTTSANAEAVMYQGKHFKKLGAVNAQTTWISYLDSEILKQLTDSEVPQKNSEKGQIHSHTIFY